MPDIKLLDCTLRDGGYVNSWNWGFAAAKDIIASLTHAGTDIVEVGFLRNVDGYNPDVTVCNTIEELNRLLPAHTGSTMYSGMAMRSNYNIAKLSPYEGHGIEMLRITAHDYDIREGMDFAREVKARGYKLSINPINIMGYADKDLLWILDQVNEIHPYQFSIVDTFGSMRRRDLERIVSLVDHNLAPDIRVGLHLHENMALSFCLAQEFLDKHLGRDTTVDGSLMGMGRIPGNLPIELIADYMNETLGCHYDIDEMMDAIQDHIAPLKGETAWGYTPAYFLSARYNLHRDYAEHYLDKGDLTNRDINHILAGFDRSKATAYDKDYADRLYREYQNRAIDDTATLDTLRTAFGGKTVLVLAPGASLAEEAGRSAVAAAKADCIVSANFCPEFCQPDYAFFTNSKRFEKLDLAALPCPVVLTSNLRPLPQGALAVNYDRLAAPDVQNASLGSNSVLMLLRLLRLCGAKAVLLAGADGYKPGTPAYADSLLHAHTGRGAAFNTAMAGAITACGLDVTFLTPSEYAKYRRLPMIRLLVLDVDGTMTDGGVYYDSTGNELKKFAIKDGAGIVLARAAGIQVMICTGRECEAVRRRAQDLHIDYLFQNVHDKAAFLSRFMAEHSLTKQDVAYCGDDLNDLTAMALCGFVACPADAAGPVLGRADFICRQKGGEGAVRGTVEEILLRDGRLPAAVKKAFGAKI